MPVILFALFNNFSAIWSNSPVSVRPATIAIRLNKIPRVRKSMYEKYFLSGATTKADPAARTMDIKSTGSFFRNIIFSSSFSPFTVESYNKFHLKSQERHC